MSSLVHAIQFTNFLVGIAAIILIGTIITVIDKWWDEIEPVIMFIFAWGFIIIGGIVIGGYLLVAAWLLLTHLGAFIISLI